MTHRILTGLAALTLAAHAPAQTVNLAATANANSAFVDFFSDAFGRADLSPTGFWQLSNSSLPADPRNTVPVSQFGSFNLFPNGTNFQLGSLTYSNSGLTGVGIETRAVTGLSLDLDNDIAISLAYTTSTSGLTGTVTFTDGQLTAVNATAGVTFTITEAPLTGSTFAGSFALTGNQFDLFVNDTASSPFGPYAARWDADGTVLAVVPEPTSFALVGLGAAGVWLRRKKSS